MVSGLATVHVMFKGLEGWTIFAVLHRLLPMWSDDWRFGQVKCGTANHPNKRW